MVSRRRGAVDDSSESEHENSFNEMPEPNTEVDELESARSIQKRLIAQKGLEDTDEDDPDNNKWPVVLKTNSMTRKRKSTQESDDEYTEESESEESANEQSDDEIKGEYSDGGFVVDSDDNLTKNYGAGGRKSRSLRRTRRRELQEARYNRAKRRKQKELNGSDSDDDDSLEVSDTSIAEELREIQGPPKKERHYRSRPPVDYAIPPPPTIEEVAKAAESFDRRRNQSQTKDHRLRRLFDVTGPFGGKDVVTLFQTSKSDLENLLSANKSSLNGDSINITAKQADTADVDPIDVGEDIDFSKVGGLDEYISKLKEMISLPLLYPELYEKFGITPPRGVLFHGPPGTGKTLMARALAASHKKEKVTFYMRKGADVLSKWIGESERQLRALFDEARANQPSIIFFDEIDGLAPVRSAKQEQHHASIVSTLLSLMDGMDNRGQVVVIGATNRPDSVDPALRRPGRFDREFYFPLPDRKARKRILEIHTSKWAPPLSSEFLDEIASQTKGFGGADLRALTTEAALLAIHHSYPQIYNSSDKLMVDPSSVTVRPQDFTLAMERIQPSSARPSSTMGLFAKPLPHYLEPLLRMAKEMAMTRVRASLPNLSTAADTQAALFLDAEEFTNARHVRNFLQGRVHRPRLLLRGSKGNGQKYLLRAITDSLEGVYVAELSSSSLTGDTSPENAIVSTISEARRRSPSCLVLPDISEWDGSSLLAPLLVGMLRSLLPSEQVLVLGAVETESNDDEQSELLQYFDSELLDVKLDLSDKVLTEFYAPILEFITRPPPDCLEAREIPKEPFKPLPPAPQPEPKDIVDLTKTLPSNSGSVFSDQDRSELRVRSQLKLKLGIILDGFRQRFRRFRKPVVEEESLVYLFEPPPEEDNAVSEQRYIRTADDKILDLATGRTYHNMDLETVEDRLWNGYYCEPLQFLEDIEKIYQDSVEFGERERMHKASEMLANAQVAIDDINADKQFSALCRSLRLKDAQKRLKEMNEVIKTEESEIHEHSGVEDVSMVDEHPETQAQVPPQAQPPHEQQEDQIPYEPVTTPPNYSGITHAPADVYTPSAQPAPQPVPELVSESITDLNKPSAPEPELEKSKSNPVSEPKRPVELTDSLFSTFKSKLFHNSKSMTLEELEQQSANLSGIEWIHRNEWNRDTMLNALLTALNE